MIARAALLVVASFTAFQAFAEMQCSVTAAISEEISRVTSIAKAQWLTFGHQDNSVFMKIRYHTLNPGGLRDGGGAPGYVSTSLVVESYQYSTTYTAEVTCIAEQWSVEFETQTNTRSVTTPDRPPGPPGSIIICDDPDRDDGTCSPIVINLGRGPYRLSGLDDPVDFDIDADGRTNRITWTARDSAVAFLAMDRNGNLRIDNGSELWFS